jgi:hypothetical protein
VNPMHSLSRISSIACAILVAGALTGCSVMTPSSSETGKGINLGNSVGIQGQIHGGQQPVSGSQVAMYAASTSGYGLAATSLLVSPGYVVSDANGNFSLTGTYTCPTNTDGSSALVYIVATGGNPGVGTNSALRMMTAVGSCAVLKANAATTNISINEVTTVASAYALSGFMTAPTSVSSSSTSAGIQGLANAFAETNLLVSTSIGQALARIPALTAVAPQAKLNALSNAIAACVNSTGSTTAMQPCGMLFAATTVNGVVPTDTLQAILNIAHNPSQNVATIFNLQSASAPFAPSAPSAPNDWTMPVTFTGGGLSAPQAVAVDAMGSVWIASKANALTAITSSGSFTYGDLGIKAPGFDAPSSVSINVDSSVWVSNCGNSCSSSGNASSLTQITPGTLPTFQQYTGNGLSATYTVAHDGTGNVWAGNTFGNSVTELSSAGSVKSGSTGYSSGGLSYPIALALDASGNAWVANPPANNIVKLNSAGVAQSGTAGYTGNGLNYPYAVAISANGNAWVANHGASSVVVFNAAGAAQSGTAGYTGAGLNLPNSLALDGAGNAWLANSNNSVSELTATGAAVSGTTGYTAGLNHANGIAVDGSGNVWLTSCGSACTGGTTDNGSVVELIGAGVPVVTPLAQGAKTNTLASRP